MALVRIQLDYVEISGQFFSAQCSGLLEKKKERLIRPNYACGRVPGTVCSVCVCVNAGFIASDWAWLHGPVLGHWHLRLGRGNRWAYPGSGDDL